MFFKSLLKIYIFLSSVLSLSRFPPNSLLFLFMSVSSHFLFSLVSLLSLLPTSFHLSSPSPLTSSNCLLPPFPLVLLCWSPISFISISLSSPVTHYFYSLFSYSFVFSLTPLTFPTLLSLFLSLLYSLISLTFFSLTSLFPLTYAELTE